MPATERTTQKADRAEPGLAREAVLRRKRRDAARLLPILGVFLLVSPFIDLFAGPARIAGLPLPAVYVFAVWFGLIAATARLARRLAADDDLG